MRVLFLPNNNEGVVFWRMYQFYKRMRERHDIDVAFVQEPGMNELYSGVWERRFEQDKSFRDKIYNVMKYADVVISQYIFSDKSLALMFMAKEAKELGKTIILAEIDDLIDATPSYNPGYRSGAFKPNSHMVKVAKEQIRMADGIVCSTKYLANSLYDDNKNSHVIPNSIDFRRWNFDYVEPKDKLTIGWIGGGNHDEDLRILSEVVPTICKKYNNVQFKIVHGCPKYLRKLPNKQVKVVKSWVTIFDYPKYMHEQKFDIGLAPLEYNRFNMAKSNLRYLEYSALHIPTVAQNMCTYNNDIINGQNGYLCKGTDQWVSALSDLIENKELRRVIGEQAYKYVYRNYNLDDITDAYVKMLKRYDKKIKQRRKEKTNEQITD